MPDWNFIFEPSVPILGTIVRGTVMYVAILALTRIVGQREAGGLSVTDVLLVVLIAEGAAPGLYGEATSIGDSLILIVTILAWSVIIDALAYRSPALASVIKSRPRPLIEDGELNRKVLKRELMTDEELEAQMRLHGIQDVGEVARAYIEPNGMISILRHDEKEDEAVERPPAM